MTQIGLVIGRIGQISMLTRSAAKAEQWYRDMLRLAHIFTFGDLVFFDCAGTRLYIREVPDAEWRASSILYFVVPDIAQAHEELLARGIKFTGAPHMIFRDPDREQKSGWPSSRIPTAIRSPLCRASRLRTRKWERC